MHFQDIDPLAAESRQHAIVIILSTPRESARIDKGFRSRTRPSIELPTGATSSTLLGSSRRLKRFVSRTRICLQHATGEPPQLQEQPENSL
jgi:hypothetical protein